MNVPMHRDPAIISHGASSLDDLRMACKSLVFATLVTDDGFEVTALSSSDNDRMASMASSMQALAEAVTRELNIGSSEYIIIAAPEGHVIQLRIPGQPLVLSALFGVQETIGKVLAASRQAAGRVSILMSE